MAVAQRRSSVEWKSPGGILSLKRFLGDLTTTHRLFKVLKSTQSKDGRLPVTEGLTQFYQSEHLQAFFVIELMVTVSLRLFATVINVVVVFVVVVFHQPDDCYRTHGCCFIKIVCYSRSSLLLYFTSRMTCRTHGYCFIKTVCYSRSSLLLYFTSR